MTELRVGTRGSELARRQAAWVCDRLRGVAPDVDCQMVVIRAAGDRHPGLPATSGWPVGAFTGALEEALLDGRIDAAVHSHKDLPTTPTAGLSIVAIPKRQAPHDVLITRRAIGLVDLPPGARIGTASPRRAAQLLSIKPFEIVPIRGNVPARLAKVDHGELDAVVVAAAGLRRLGIEHPYAIDLPVDRFVPAPAQGALAVQTRGDSPHRPQLARLDDPVVRRCVTAERAFLAQVSAGCATPAGALAVPDGDGVDLRAQLFSPDLTRVVVDRVCGSEPAAVGRRLGLMLAGRINLSC